MTLSEQIQQDRKNKIWSGKVPNEDKHFTISCIPHFEDEEWMKPKYRKTNCVVCGKECYSNSKRPCCSRKCASILSPVVLSKYKYFKNNKEIDIKDESLKINKDRSTIINWCKDNRNGYSRIEK